MSKQTDLINIPDAITVSGSNVGVGTTSPSSKLTVLNGTANTQVASFSGADSGGGLKILTASTTRSDDTVILKASDAFGEIAFTSDNTEVMRITKDNNVGIGTTSPTHRLDVLNDGGEQLRILAWDQSASARANIDFWYLDAGGSPNQNSQISTLAAGNAGNGNLIFSTRPTSGTLTERMRILSGGGITFNGDTAAANALDDYEEGDWTPAPNSGSFSASGGRYTKIGRVVTLNFDITVGSGGGSFITLPFSSATTTSNAIYTSSQNFAAGRTAFYGVAAGTSMFFRVTGDNVTYIAQGLDVGATIHASITYQTT